MKLVEIGEKNILESDSIVIGSMHNAVFRFKIQEITSPYIYKTDSVEKHGFHSWRNLIIEIGPRIDCGFNQTFNFNTVTSKDVRSLANAISRLADDMEETPSAVE